MIIPNSSLLKSIRQLKPRDNSSAITSEHSGLVRMCGGFDRWSYSDTGRKRIVINCLTE